MEVNAGQWETNLYCLGAHGYCPCLFSPAEHHYQSTGGTWPGNTFRHVLHFLTGQMIIVKKEGKTSRSFLTWEMFSFTSHFLSLQPNLPSGVCWHRRLWKQTVSVGSKGLDKFTNNMFGTQKPSQRCTSKISNNSCECWRCTKHMCAELTVLLSLTSKVGWMDHFSHPTGLYSCSYYLTV